MSSHAEIGYEGEYTVRRYKHGVAIFGGIPMADMAALFGAFEKDGMGLMCAGISSAIGATFAIASEDGVEAWTAEIEAGIDQRAPLDRWLAGAGTGISAKTIVQAITGRRVFSSPHGPSIPHDPSDFNRCVKLLRAVPELRSGLPKVAEKHPRWAGLVKHWDELEALLDEEAPTGSCPKLWDRMQELTR